VEWSGEGTSGVAISLYFAGSDDEALFARSGATVQYEGEGE